MTVPLDLLTAFVTVAEAGGFRGAATASGRSASALSQSLRTLEDRLGVRLLNRTTRSVALTDAGAALLSCLQPALRDIAEAVDAVNLYRGSPHGTLRLNAPAPAAQLVLAPLLGPFLAEHPHIRVDVVVETALIDIVKDGYDAGVRWGESLAKDMIAVSLGPAQRFGVVASPALVAARGRPQHPRELLELPCLRQRFPSGAFLPWEFEKGGEAVVVNPEGPLGSTSGDLLLAAALDGLGYLYTFEGYVAAHVAAGRLVPLLADWCEEFPGPFLYYPSHRHAPAPLRAFVDFVRRRRRDLTPAG